MARWQVVVTGGVLLTSWSDRYILGIFFVPAVVGAYAIASLLATQLHNAFAEVGTVLFPAVSDLEGRGELRSARRLALLVGWTLTSSFGVFAAVLAVIGGDFLQLWIARDVGTAAQFTLRLLCVAAIADLATIAPFTYVVGIGRPRVEALATVGGSIAVLSIGIILAPRLGLAGVGYGLIAGTLVRWTFVAFIWRTYFAVDQPLRAFAAHAWAPPLVSIGITGALSALHDRIPHSVTWPALMIEALAALAIAALVQFVVGEILPGGAQRRRDVVASFKPILVRFARGATP